MRFRYYVLLAAFAGSFLSARADEIFSGYVGLGYSATSNGICAASGTGAGSVSVSCSANDRALYSRFNGSGNAFAGSLMLDMAAPGSFYTPNPSIFSFANGTGQLHLNEAYELTRGTGSGVLTLQFEPGIPWGSIGPAPPYVACALSLNGVQQQACQGSPYGFYAETIPYNVPYSIDLLLTLNGVASGGFFGDGVVGRLDYSVAGPGLEVVATPEPASFCLLVPGLIGMLAAVRARRRG